MPSPASSPMSRHASHGLLYLDFDGVLHPADVHWSPQRGVFLGDRAQGHSLFEHAQLLAELLEDFPAVRLVLSTSWVPVRGLAATVACLPSALQARVVGATYDSKLMLHEAWASVARGYQVLEDVERRRPAHWVAIDDDDKDWPTEHRHRLVKTDAQWGLSQAGAIEELRAHFATWGTKA